MGFWMGVVCGGMLGAAVATVALCLAIMSRE